jgi:hypothetical protein
LSISSYSSKRQEQKKKQPKKVSQKNEMRNSKWRFKKKKKPNKTDSFHHRISLCFQTASAALSPIASDPHKGQCPKDCDAALTIASRKGT